MKVFLTGGTGFVGSEVCRRLKEAGHSVRLLVRTRKPASIPADCELWSGDATDPNSLAGGLDGCDAVIHLVGIIREFPEQQVTFRRLHVDATRNVVAAASKAGIRRYLHMSANGTRPGAVAEYHRTKWEAEELVRAAGLDATIFRPSLIFGAHDAFVNMLADMIRRFPIVPVIGDGEYRMSPVAVGDVAAGFVKALEHPDSIGRIYHCCGPDALSYNEILDDIAAALDRRITRIHQPVAMMRFAAGLFDRFSAFPITSGQLTMLLEGNVCAPRPWADDFAITPTPFRSGIRAYLHP